MTKEAEHLKTPGALMTVAEAASLLRLSQSTLHKWRVFGSGPKYLKLGSRIRYRLADLDDFVAKKSRASTSENGSV